MSIISIKMSNGKIYSILVKPSSADCNLRCTYCFYRRPLDPYKDRQRPRMNDEVLSALIEQFLQMNWRGAGFSWQGGEPTLMGIDFFKKVTDLQMKYGSPGQQVGNAIQTNGVLLNDEWARFLGRYKFLAGISLDGPEHIHDHYRGKGTFQKVMNAIRLLRAHKVEFNTLTVVNDITSEKVDEVFDFLHGNDFFYLQFIPCVERDLETGEITPFSVKTSQYEKFLCRAFDRWYGKGRPYFSVRLFDNVLQAYLGMEAEACEFRKACGDYVVVEYNGDVYPCDHLVFKEWYMGNMLETPLEKIVCGEIAQKFNTLKPAKDKRCSKCRWNFICNHGCPRYRFPYPDRPSEKHYLCEAYEKFFRYSEKKFRKLAARLRSEGKAPLQT